MDTQEAHEKIQYVIDLASTSMQIAEGLMLSIAEAHGELTGSFGDHAEMVRASQQAHHTAALTVRHLRELMDLAEAFRGLLPQ